MFILTSHHRRTFTKWFLAAGMALALVSTMLLAGARQAFAGTGVVITPPGGTTGVSIDTTSHSGGTGTWISGQSIVIAENAADQIGSGAHTLTLPTGWEFDNSQLIAVGTIGGTNLTLSGTGNITPLTDHFNFNVTVTSGTGPDTITFSNIKIRPTGTVVSSGNVTETAGTIAGVTNSVTSFGTLSTGPGVATQFVVTTQHSGTETAGTAFSVTSTAEDQFGNIVNGANGGANNYNGSKTANWTWTANTSPAPRSVAPTKPANASQSYTNGVLTLAGFTLTNAGETPTIHVTDGSISGTSASITVNPGTAASLTITGSGSETAGASQDLTITAKDADSNTATSYTGNKTLTFSGASTSPAGTHPTVKDNSGATVNFGTATTISFSAGIASVSGSNNGRVTLYKKEAATLAVTDGSIDTGAGGATLAVTVSGATTNSLFFSNAAGTTLSNTISTPTAGGAFNVYVAETDQYGNLDTAAGDSIVLAGETGDGTAPGNAPDSTPPNYNSPQTAASGVATFSVTLYKAETGRQIKASFGGFTSDTSTTFAVNAGTDSAYRISAASGTPAAGATDVLTITIVDRYQNQSAYSGDKALTFSGLNAALDTTVATVTDKGGTPVNLGTPTTITFTTGNATSGGTLVAHKAEAGRTLAATDGTLTTASTGGTGASLAVSVGADSAYRISAASGTPAAGATDVLTIHLVDQYQNQSAYSGDKSLTFSGLATSPAGNIPTVTDKTAAPVNLGTPTTITFTGGNATVGGTLVAYDKQGPVTLAATDETLTTATPGGAGVNLTVSSTGVQSAYRISAASGTPAAGATDVLTIKAVDQYGNTEASVTGTDKSLTFSGLAAAPDATVATVTNKIAGLISLGSPTVITFTSGVSSAGGTLVAHKAEGPVTLAATDGTLTTATTGGAGVSLTVSAGAANKLAFLVQPASAGSVDAALGTQPTVVILDQYSNLTSDTSTVTLTAVKAPGNVVAGDGALTGTASMAAVGGVAAFTNVGYTKLDTIHLHAADGGLTVANSTTDITLTVGTAAKLSFSVQPAGTNSVDVAITTQPTVRILDQYDNLTAATSTVTLTPVLSSDNLTSGAGSLTGTASMAAVGGVAAFTNVGYTKLDSIHLHAADGGLTAANSTGTITLTFGAIAHYSVSAISDPQTAGTAFSVAIQAQDQYSNNITSGAQAAETVTATKGLADAGATWTTPINTAAGTATVSDFVMHKAQAGQSITFTGGTSTRTGTSNTFTVNAGAANTLTFTQAAASVGNVDSPLSTQPIVHVVDQYGNTVANGTHVVATKASGAGALRGTLDETTSSGDATFTNVGYNKTDSFSITFTSNAHTATSGGLTMTAGAADEVSIDTQPANTNGTVDNALQTQPSVHITDQFGNDVANGTSVAAILVSGTGTLRNASATTGGGAGVATFGTLGYSKSGESFNMKFRASGNPSTDSAESSSVTALLPGAANTLTFTRAAASEGSVDSALSTQPVVHVVDQYGNTVADGTHVVATKASGAGTLQGTLDETTTSGDATFTDVGYNGTDSFSIRFTSNAHTATSGGLTMTPGAATTVTFTQAPASVGSVDSPLSTQPIVHVVDQYGNTVANGTHVVATKASGSGALHGTLDETTSSGDATFTNMGYNKTDSFSVDFTSNGHTVNSSALTLTVGAAAKLSFSVQPAGTNSVDVAITTQPTVRILDQYDNLTAATTTVTLTARLAADDTTPASGALTNSGTPGVVSMAAVGGVAAFTNVGYTKLDSIHLHAADGGLTAANSSGTIALVFGAIDHYGVSAVSDPQTAGTPFSVTIHAQDQFSNNITDTSADETANITVAGGHADAGLSPTSVAVVNGTASHNITLTKAYVGGQALTFTGVSTKTGTSNTFAVDPGAVDHFTVTGITTPVVAGTSTSPVVTAYDGYNNTKTNYAGTIHFSSTDTGSSTVLPVDYTFVAGTGTHTFTTGVVLTTAGTQSVTVADGAHNGTQTAIAVRHAGTVTSLSVTAPATAVTGTPIDVTVAALDTYGNVMDNGSGATPYQGSVFLFADQSLVPTVNQPAWGFSGNTGSQTLTHAVEFSAAGTGQVHARDISTPTLTGDSSTITVSAAIGAPTLSAVQVSGLVDTTATISWTSDIDAATNGNKIYISKYSAMSPLDTTLGTSGVVTFDHVSHATPMSYTFSSVLLPNTTYYYQVKTTGTGAQSTMSPIYSFTTAAASTGVATSVQVLKSYATADGTYTNGWEFKMTITVNNPAETYLKLKFNDWVGSGADIPAGGNMKIALDDNVAGVQAGSDGVAVGNLYANEATALTLTDLNPNVGGIQTVVYVYVAVPPGTSGGSYSTSYGVRTATTSSITD